jgi:hypothetical protein
MTHRVDATSEIANSLIQLSKDGKDGFTTNVSGSKHRWRRDGNDTHLAALLSDWRSLVDEPRVPTSPTKTGKLIHRQQGSVTLHEFTYLSRGGQLFLRNRQQPVNEGILPREGSDTRVSFSHTIFEQPGVAVQPIEGCRWDTFRRLGVEAIGDNALKPTIVSALRAWAPDNRILAARCMYPSTFSQLIAKPYHYALFKVQTDLVRTSVGLGDVTGMVEQPFRDACHTSHWKSPRAPGEGQAATRLRQCDTLKPPLKGLGYFIHVICLATRKRNVTEGHTQGLHLVCRPVRTTWTGSGYPLPEDPTTMLLRKTTGNETCPNCLPDSSLGIDFTPMGLLAPSLFRRGTRGTYYTAKKR